MPQETKSVHNSSEHKTLQGRTATAADPEALRKGIDLALDYRGDVTIMRRTNAEPLECFIFDVKRAQHEITAIRAISKGRDEKIMIAFSEIAAITFSGRDTAAGRSFETWMKNYVKKKLAGEEASIHSESLD